MAPDPLEALRTECELVSEVVMGLVDEDWVRPTRCSAWDVKELLGHMYRDVDRTNVALSQPPPDRADNDSVSYWRSYDRVGDAPDIADRAKQFAASHPTGRDLAVAWDEMWRRADQTALRAERSRIVVTWGPALTLDEFLRTRVLEITVHGTDLAHALGRPAWATDAGLAVTNDILLRLLGADLPPGLGWSELTFLEKGSGRSELSDSERDGLGQTLSARFPLMG
jgi:uncharacterized protein (TIGR03083 family)